MDAAAALLLLLLHAAASLDAPLGGFGGASGAG
jgi:hypothetical protein